MCPIRSHGICDSHLAKLDAFNRSSIPDCVFSAQAGYLFLSHTVSLNWMEFAPTFAFFARNYECCGAPCGGTISQQARHSHIKSLSHQYLISKAIVQRCPDTFLPDLLGTDLRRLTLKKIDRHMPNHFQIMRRLVPNENG